jgi:hypothetical protein
MSGERCHFPLLWYSTQWSHMFWGGEIISGFKVLTAVWHCVVGSWHFKGTKGIHLHKSIRAQRNHLFFLCWLILEDKRTMFLRNVRNHVTGYHIPQDWNPQGTIYTHNSTVTAIIYNILFEVHGREQINLEPRCGFFCVYIWCELAYLAEICYNKKWHNRFSKPKWFHSIRQQCSPQLTTAGYWQSLHNNYTHCTLGCKQNQIRNLRLSKQWIWRLPKMWGHVQDKHREQRPYRTNMILPHRLCNVGTWTFSPWRITHGLP